jgi:gamma-glutamyltranspeptidase/glutathione hydrolase
MFGAGGTAADAAAAAGLALAVTLPSRAGLGGGGHCLVYDPAARRVEELAFPLVPASPAVDARWRASTPHLARGLYALHARGGRLPWARIVAPAERLARGFQVSPLLAEDIKSFAGTLGNDRAAQSLVLTRDRRVAGPGDRLSNPDLGITFARLRGRGPGDFYLGAQAKELADAADAAGASLGVDDLRAAVPDWRAPAVTASSARTVATVSGAGGTTAIVAAGAGGEVVACVLGLGRPFGLGLLARGHGFLFAAVPEPDSDALAIVHDAASGHVVFVGGATGPRASERLAAAAAGSPIEAPSIDGGGTQVLVSCPNGLALDGEHCLMRGQPAAGDHHVIVAPRT